MEKIKKLRQIIKKLISYLVTKNMNFGEYILISLIVEIYF